MGTVHHILVETDEVAAQYPPVVDRVLELSASYARVGLKISPDERGGVIEFLQAFCKPTDNDVASAANVTVSTGLTESTQLLLAPYATFQLELTNLRPYVSYACQLAASTSAGMSDQLSVVQFRTRESRPSKPWNPVVAFAPPEVVEQVRKESQQTAAAGGGGGGGGGDSGDGGDGSGSGGGNDQSPSTVILTVSWSQPIFPGGEIQSYQLWMSANGGETYSRVYQGINTTAIISVDETIPLDSIYFQVVIVNSASLTASSDIVSASEWLQSSDSSSSSSSSSSSASKSQPFTVLIVVGAVLTLFVIFLVGLVRQRRRAQTTSNTFEQLVSPDDPWLIPPECVVFTQAILGRGQFGNVEGVFVNLNMHGAPVSAAAKTCLFQTASHVNQFLEEIKVMKVLNADGGHPNVVKLMGICQKVNNP